MNTSIKDIVKDNIVTFQRLRNVNAFYTVCFLEDFGGKTHDAVYEFPVPLSDIGDATLHKEEKAILLMRYIRKAIDEGTFVKIPG